MYERHFGLARPAFRITPDPEYFFAGGNRGAVLEALRYAIGRGEGVVKVVGEVGSGKTMLCRMLERELPENCEVVYLANPRLSPDEILHAIAFELALEPAPGAPRLALLQALTEHLLARHAEDRRVVLFVEEAQGMPLESLEEIRMLSNLETSRDKLLQIVLFGQPELEDRLARHDIRQLRERITHAFTLAPLGRAAVRDYLNARLRASGQRGGELFTRSAIAALARHSQGLLRRINVLADKALLAAFADGATRVDAAHVRRAARDSGYRRAAPRRARVGLVAAGLAAVAVVAGGALWWLGDAREKLPPGGGEAPSAPRPPPAPATLGVPEASPAPTAALPALSPESGLVTLEHLEPVLVPPPAGPGGGPPEVLEDGEVSF